MVNVVFFPVSSVSFWELLDCIGCIGMMFPLHKSAEEDYDAPHVDVEAMKENLKDPGIVGLLRSGVKETTLKWANIGN